MVPPKMVSLESPPPGSEAVWTSLTTCPMAGRQRLSRDQTVSEQDSRASRVWLVVASMR